MTSRFPREIGLILTWLAFPLIPVVLEDAYFQFSVANFNEKARFGLEPRDWDWTTWVVMLGPLIGYGFVAGATVSLPEEGLTERRRLRWFLSRRSVWVAIGPWSGALFLAACLAALVACGKFVEQFGRQPNAAPPAPQAVPVPVEEAWFDSTLVWIGGVLFWVAVVMVFAIWSYGWLWPAWAALRRAKRVSNPWHAFYRGVIVGFAFVSSLFGSFWAATSLWRGYFFDPRVVPLLLVAVGLMVTSGCSSDITYGEVRRRELFHAMLVAWTLGLALMWRWWSRRSGDGKDHSGP